MSRFSLTTIAVLCVFFYRAQLPVGFDTITVIENNYVQKMPWGNGLNYSNFSNIDLNNDGKKDLVAFDKLNQFGVGRFRCFIKTGNAGQETYTVNTQYSYYFPQNITNWAILLDYNADGKEDIFCSASGGIMVYKNTSNGANLSFTLEKPLLYSYYPSFANLYASSAGVPGIADMDNDGDLDVMTFAPQGIFVEFHQNMSMEAYGHVNSLDTFQLNTGCWGKIIENNCVVSFSQTCAMKPWPDYHPELNEKRHAGSCLTCIDIDGDTDKELIMGDVSCNHVQLAYNGGSVASALVTDTTKLYPNYPNKNSTTQIKMNNFPCTYLVDVNGDGNKDLMATPNAFGSENYKSTWYYKNTSSTSTVNFQFVKNNFLQDEMIEVGQSSFPVVFDYNADGKKDLLVGTFGYYNSNSLKAQLTLYENKGTLAQPSFSLITRDYAGLSTYSLSYAIPAVGDIDGDGDTDLLIGTSQGKVHLLTNTAGAGNPCSFATLSVDPYSFTSPTSIAAVQVFDINKDGKPDLMLGGKNGKINYYKNIGTLAAPAFTLQSAFFGKINVQGDPNLYGIDGHSAPFFYDEATVTKLLVGSVSGQIFYYTIPPLVNDTCTAILINANTNGLKEGAQSSVCYEDINNDGIRDLFVGNAGGGLNFLSSKAPDVGINENPVMDELVSLFPVPATQELTVSVKEIDADKIDVKVFDLLGRLSASAEFSYNSGVMNISGLSKGIYFARITITSDSRTLTITKKIIKE
ncbi:MAG: hypothetical protein K0S12_55 [Bacteroidetes bacterium]|nr:hypothetical protein [Bacteroidota bacterium]